MSRTIHINLLKNSERRSHMPVRTLVMVPAITSLLLLCLVVWALLLSSQNATLASDRDNVISKKGSFKSAEAEYKEIKNLEAIAKSELGQLESYTGARIVFADVLERFPRIVPEALQLTSLDIMPPQRPLPVKDEKQLDADGQVVVVKKPVKKETFVAEKVTLKLVGLVDSANSIDALRAELLTAPFTTLIVNTEIPSGGFKVSGDRSNTFIFEVNCECVERVFK